MLTWNKYIREVTEQRRLEAIAKCEIAPDIRGVSNYERAEIMETAHRARQVTEKEKCIGRGLRFGVPAIILTIFFTNAQF